MITSVIGIDPGPTTGMSFLEYKDEKYAGGIFLQVDGPSALTVLEAVLGRYYVSVDSVGPDRRFSQVEPFITGQGAGTKGGNAEVTRQLAFELGERLQLYGYHVARRRKIDIDKWASDKRLKTLDILRPPENRHANDASRHALYAAVHDVHMPDPLR